MGGCRCSFRQCHVNSSKYPRMHFFRFPLKESERFSKWMRYAQMERMVQFTDVRKKNTSICARHFRPECFMNYKMERLAPKAVPTLMRLSKDQALDFELDIEKGVLITMEETKLKHLIPPDNFEDPLHLENDKILMEMLNVAREQESTTIILHEDIEYIESSEEVKRFAVMKPEKSPLNSIEILETIQVSSPTLKRNRELVIDEIENGVASTTQKKFKILNSAHCSAIKDNKDETTIVLTSAPDQNDDNHVIINDNLEFEDTDNIEHQNDIVNDRNEMLLISSGYNNNSSENDDENIEFFEVHKCDTDLLHDMITQDSDSTIVQLKADTLSSTGSIKEQILTLQSEILDLKNQNEDMEGLQIKITLLENENSDLRKYCKEYQELRRKYLALELENNRMKTMLKEHNTLKEELLECKEENKKLKEDTAGIVLLKSKLLSRQQEPKELENIAENINNSKEIITLQKKVDIKQKLLSDVKNQVEKIESDLKDVKNENKHFIKDKNCLEESLNNLQKRFEATQNDYKTLKFDYDSLQQKHSDLQKKYWKIQAIHTQETTVSTSLEKSNFKIHTAATPSPPALTKAQLFNGIKRYLSAAMVSLLRMEMFGSSEREWKTDERQVAVDILRLGETTYKYFTDEWRFRLPALRDVHNWLSQSVQMDYEDDL
ncbi:hypothetical protein DOY81_002363 [Sarcophaga bullata]|nr:hypothetical protein DOY81_002363 [Sarcophaga bullata]